MPNESHSSSIFLNYGMPYFRFLCLKYPLSLHSLSESFRSFIQFECNESSGANSSPQTVISSSSSTDKQTSLIDVFYCNARSLLPKMNILNNYVSFRKPLVIAITETWLESTIPLSMCCPPGFTPYRKDRFFARGGGALILVSERIVSKPISLFLGASDTESKIDAVACELSLRDEYSLGVLCLYRPPALSAIENSILYDILTNFLNYKFSYNVIVGDFNFPDIHWPSSSSSLQSDTFLQFVQANFLQQHVQSITRQSSSAILDLVLSTPGTEITDLSVNEELGTSDHSIIEFTAQTKPVLVRRKVRKRNFKNTDWSYFRNLLSSSSNDWSQVLHSDNLDDVWAEFVKLLNSALDRVAPYQDVTIRNYSSTSQVRTALRYKRRAYRSLIRNFTYDTLVAYERSVAIAEVTLKCDTAERENRVINSKDPKLFWSYVNRR